MRRNLRLFECSIAGERVGISLRHGGGPGEPRSRYVRCEDRECQYVDLNVPPCPLRVQMFADGSERLVADYLAAHVGTRFCYACLVDALEVTHDQVRRASWQFRDLEGYSIRPSRCTVCRRRGVTIGVKQSSGLVERDRGARTLIERLASYLRARPGYAFCVHCLSPEIGRPSPQLREEISELEATGDFSIRIAQCVSCLLTKPVIRHEEPSGDEAVARRVIEFLVGSAGEGSCASCIAFATDLALATVRRVLEHLEPLTEFPRRDASCSGCGRWLAVVRYVA